METDNEEKRVYKEGPWDEKIKELIAVSGADPSTFQSDLIKQIIASSLKMLTEDHDMGELKLMTRAFKEMRYAYTIFKKYPSSGRRISIFGSARTPESHPDYIAAKNLSTKMASNGWVCITGAADGIMRAGLEGAQGYGSFGLSIRLPFETPSQSLLAGDPRLITFRYFFTRKLMFLSHSDAIAAFPGGVGTQDELFEVLTLMQTGKANIVPVILLEGIGGDYWKEWLNYINKSLLKNGWISEDDLNLFHLASSPEEAYQHIIKFYHRFHSSRYVRNTLVIRLLTPLNEKQINELNKEFQILIQSGDIYSTKALPEEDDHLDLPRIAFEHNHRHFGTLRKLIDRINAF